MSPLVFLLPLLFFLQGSQCLTINYTKSDCSNTSTFTSTAPFGANLQRLFSTLTTNAASAPSGFFNSSVGDSAYGLLLCRGDISPNECNDCISMARKEITQNCPGSTEAAIWKEECMLRYSNRSIFSVLQDSPQEMMHNVNNIADLNRWNQLLGATLEDITTAAAKGGTHKKFATKEAAYTALQTLYTLAQCTPDISAADCSRCFQVAKGYLPMGKQGGIVLTPSCNIRFEVYPFYQNFTLPPTPLVPAGAPTERKGKKKMTGKVIAAIVVPVATVSALLIFVGVFLLSKRKMKKHDAFILENTTEDFMTPESLQYDLATLQTATNNFSEDNKIGQGGFGSVYRGTLANGQEIAVKRLSKSSGQGVGEFKNEVVLVAKLQHRNLVRLLGFCLASYEKLLVYEFVPNKSLNYFLFDPEKQGQLDWPRRYKIIGGIARGILYLHEDSRLRIIHRDLKASNILLDGDMNPKISDFGMARIFGVEQTQDNTSRVVGTYGYMAPEYAMHGQYSIKSDVYSFGVLMLEIISGKRISNFFQSNNVEEDLVSYAWRHWREDTPLELMDPTLRDSYSREEVMRCIHLGLLCVQEDMDHRPSMASIVLTLSNCTAVTLPGPQRPAFFARSRMESAFIQRDSGSDQSTTTSKSMPWSINETSITELDPR